ncbi:putative reverse transcriptase zinc-binding domain-containing protein [Helianthus annuus]|nr:putative reverse transcriptase zinc-binding domain-containing protein [Helianthus annuus]
MKPNGSRLEFKWAWRSSALGNNESSQLQQLLGLINGLNGPRISSGADKWLWKFDGSGMFNVASIKKILGTANRVRPARVFEWNNWVPKKVGIVAWRAEMERLPTKCALLARNIPVQNQTCVMCGNYDETSEHIFVSCHFAQLIWQNVAIWCLIPLIIAFDIKDLLTLHEISSGSTRKKKVLYAIILVTLWSIWKSRNEFVFQQITPNTTKILEEIKAMAYLGEEPL